MARRINEIVRWDEAEHIKFRVRFIEPVVYRALEKQVVVVVLPCSSLDVCVIVVAPLSTVPDAAVMLASDGVTDVILLTVSLVPRRGAKST